MKKYKIGYTQGVFDLLHYGHIRLLKRAKDLCEVLIVGINSDVLVEKYKNKKTIMKQDERLEIVSSLKYVDNCFIVYTLDKIEILSKINYDVIFIGDDWINNKRWLKTKKDLSLLGKDVVFLPHTDGVSTTMLKDKIKKNI